MLEDDDRGSEGERRGHTGLPPGLLTAAHARDVDTSLAARTLDANVTFTCRNLFQADDRKVPGSYALPCVMAP